MKLTIGEAQKLTSPNPFALVSTITPEGETNVMALSWWTYMSNHPAMIGICLSNKGFSGKCIKESGEFVLNIVSEGLEDAAFKCGTCSGRDINKAEQFGIKLCNSEMVKAKQVENSKIVFECKLKDCVDIGDHTFYIGEAVTISGNQNVKALYAFDGYGKLGAIK